MPQRICPILVDFYMCVYFCMKLSSMAAFPLAVLTIHPVAMEIVVLQNSQENFLLCVLIPIISMCNSAIGIPSLGIISVMTWMFENGFFRHS